jgi:hypothetical protein
VHTKLREETFSVLSSLQVAVTAVILWYFLYNLTRGSRLNTKRQFVKPFESILKIDASLCLSQCHETIIVVSFLFANSDIIIVCLQ